MFPIVSRRIRAAYSAAALLSLSILAVWYPSGALADDASESNLRRYVRSKDDAYGWKLAKTVPGNPSRTLVVQLTSQRWRREPEVNRAVWEHWLNIVVPAQVTSNTAFLMIGGGANGGAAPDQADRIATEIARATGSVVAELKQVPNQPLEFHGDGVGRKEDDLIAYAWNEYLKSGDPTWLPRFPMVKSAVRAMDAVQELLASEEQGRLTIDKFVVAGASKRGWTTWMTGAADPRVAAIVPIVIDVVNVDPSMRHHAQVYGFWANSIGDYVQHGITKQWNTPGLRALLKEVDPYFHREHLQMPKYLVNAAGDQFFCPDSSQFYYDELLGEKLLRYVPNADHSLRNSDAVESIAAFHQRILKGTPRPEYSWKFLDNGAIRVTSRERPDQVLLWQAVNPKARDFRLETIGPAFKSRELTADGEGAFVAELEAPNAGWSASFIELTFGRGPGPKLKVTSAVRILPDRLPHANIDPTTTPYEATLKK